MKRPILIRLLALGAIAASLFIFVRAVSGQGEITPKNKNMVGRGLTVVGYSFRP